jgi:hypothetical protein
MAGVLTTPQELRLERVVGLTVVGKISDPVDYVLQDGGASEDQDASLRRNERDGAEASEEAETFPGEGQPLERFFFVHGEGKA